MFLKSRIEVTQVQNFKCVRGRKCAQACIFLDELKNKLLSINASHNSERQFIGYLENSSIAEWRSQTDQRIMSQYVSVIVSLRQSFPANSSFDGYYRPKGIEIEGTIHGIRHCNPLSQFGTKLLCAMTICFVLFCFVFFLHSTSFLGGVQCHRLMKN